MTKAHFVNHTHWDREWYFTTEDAQVLSDQLFSNVLKELETHPEANFTLDGQTSILDEYVEMHPEDIIRIKKLINRNQLFVGPWYTQTDAMIPDAESIIRNLVIGINDTKQKYGQPMMIGYLPDTFGFNSQLPMLLNQVGINDFIFWRGTNFKRQMDSVYFKWHSLGHSQVYAANFPLGYYTGQIALDSKKNLQEFVANRLDPGIDFESQQGQNNSVLVPSGIDQMNIIHNVSETISKINKYSHNQIVISNYPKFMRTLRQRNDLADYQGELRYPTYARVHRTIGSVRSRIKRQNFKLEQQILRRVEPLMVIAKRCGIDVSKGLILKLWKKLLECQPHDSLGGSVSDNVAIDIDHRFKQGFEIADGIENYIKKRIAQRLKLDANQVLVFNTDPRPFNGYKKIRFLTSSKNIMFDEKYQATILSANYVAKRENIMQQTAKGFEFKDEPGYYELQVQVAVQFDGLGYQVIDFKDGAEALPELQSEQQTAIQNESWKVNYVDGKFQATTNGKTYKNIISIVDSGNDGDTYDYSPLRGDKEVDLPLAGVVAIYVGAGRQELRLSGKWQLPEGLADRISHEPKLRDVAFELTLTLIDGDNVLAGRLTVDNQVLDHRLRLKINTAIESDTAVAQVQGGFQRTRNLPIAENWEEEFVEKPVNLYNFDKIVGMQGASDGLYLIAKGMKEYELGKKAFYVTLMATTGQLGKPNLLWRPGRASGDTTSIGHQMTPTPLAEELGANTFEFGLVSTSQLNENKLAIIAEKWLAPDVSYQLQKLNLFVNRLDNKIWDVEFDDSLPTISECESFLKLDPHVTISALYPAYTVPNSFVIRLANESGVVADLTPLLKQHFIQVNALEEAQPCSEQLVIQPYDMVTLLIHNQGA
ncbi:alpha-mannosidase [Lactiplantibacillus plantarum]|uniref:alpha-mannosidase n=1 Tax=Lactiplantibacillus plantarum TaxID=1590 RepID=UPI000A17B5A9|nr:glycoside hydrolase family 38 C-terminal domain-containing protein [Lactiplantibacillus plantarum]ARK35405.1 alpha-mannosidase [Lactiplantibacillus plantarum]QAR77392.1 alpha-mannosidase [Lactiplantibacillus plantarum]QAS31326.1 alpha-mannosidase [Lactiplantibacillus plantarum]RWZ49500.1 alpha-mannosidase [Lactiplantibacillus plantarum]